MYIAKLESWIFYIFTIPMGGILWISDYYYGRINILDNPGYQPLVIALKLYNIVSYHVPTHFIQFPLAECHFLVDLDLSETTPLQPHYSQDTVHWETVLKRLFLDAGRSDTELPPEELHHA